MQTYLIYNKTLYKLVVIVEFKTCGKKVYIYIYIYNFSIQNSFSNLSSMIITQIKIKSLSTLLTIASTNSSCSTVTDVSAFHSSSTHNFILHRQAQGNQLPSFVELIIIFLCDISFEIKILPNITI